MQKNKPSLTNVTAPGTTGGNTITYVGDYAVHTFLANGTFTVAELMVQ